MLDHAATQPPRRTRFIDGVKLATKAGMKAGLIAPPHLDIARMKAHAAAKAGSDDFGDDWFERPLQKLVEAVQNEAQLFDAAAIVAQKQMEKVLIDRLRAQQWFARHPEILERPIKAPVIIAGPMRSGTTRLHRLLSADQRFTHLRSFETINPVPFPGFQPGAYAGQSDPRIALTKRIRLVAKLANPNTLAIHPTGPCEPEEELGLLVNSFWSMKHDAQWHIPSFGRWCEGQDATPAYQQMARLLKLVGWSQQASSLKPWVLKTPQHMLDLDALLNVFPDARFIFTHRNPVQVVASSASLAWNQTCIYSDHADPHVVGREWLRKTRVQVDTMQRHRLTIAPERMIDVHYEDVDADWRSEMQRIYRFLDLDIARAQPAMESYSSRASTAKRKPHRYSLAQFGLTEAQVLSQLGSYIDAFGVGAGQRRARA